MILCPKPPKRRIDVNLRWVLVSDLSRKEL